MKAMTVRLFLQPDLLRQYFTSHGYKQVSAFTGKPPNSAPEPVKLFTFQNRLHTLNNVYKF